MSVVLPHFSVCIFCSAVFLFVVLFVWWSWSWLDTLTLTVQYVTKGQTLKNGHKQFFSLSSFADESRAGLLNCSIDLAETVELFRLFTSGSKSGRHLDLDNPSRRQGPRDWAVGLRLEGSRCCVCMLFEYVVGYKNGMTCIRRVWTLGLSLECSIMWLGTMLLTPEFYTTEFVQSPSA